MPLQDASWYSYTDEYAFQAGSLLLPLPLPRRQCRYRNAFQAGSLLHCPCPCLADSVGTVDLPLPLSRRQCRYSFINYLDSLMGPRAPALAPARKQCRYRWIHDICFDSLPGYELYRLFILAGRLTRAGEWRC